MSSFKFINQDSDKAKNGIWWEHEQGRFLIGSPVAEDSLIFLESRTTALQKKNLKFRDGKPVEYQIKKSEEVSIAVDLTLEFVLLDWEIKDSRGDEVKFTKKFAKSALINDPEFNKFVNECALDAAKYDKSKSEAKVKK